MKAYLAAPAVLSALLLTGCLTSTQATRLQNDLDEVKRQVFQVQQETSGSRAQLEAIDRRLSSQTPAGTRQADLHATLETLLDQLQALSLEMESIRSRVGELSAEIRQLRQASLIASGPGTPGPSTVMGPPAMPGAGPEESPGGEMTPPGQAGTAPPPLRPMGDGADQVFQTAYADYSRGNYELAVMGFSDLLRSYPGDSLAPDAQYWIGECLYSQGKFREAVEAFDRTIERYPADDKVPPAMLKKGLSQMELGQTTQAVATLQGLIESAPRSDEAGVAAERLKQLGLRSQR